VAGSRRETGTGKPGRLMFTLSTARFHSKWLSLPCQVTAAYLCNTVRYIQVMAFWIVMLYGDVVG
jgi:hypothetical protein